MINSRQRFAAWTEARNRQRHFKGSMLFVERAGTAYLTRDSYDAHSGVKRQRSLGRRSPDTERMLSDFQEGKAQAGERYAGARRALERQAALNRALGLGRVPRIGADILRALDDRNLLGKGVRVAGTYALFAYEAAAGVVLSSDITTTDDIDLVFDSRSRLRLTLEDAIDERTLLGLLQKVDRSFERSSRTFQAANRDGYVVDLIRPMRQPPWKEERSQLTDDPTDLDAVAIEGLVWQENMPSFDSVGIDARGAPVRLVVPDPRAFAVHKLWLSRRADRNPLKRRRDALQAKAAARLVSNYLLHLPFEPSGLRSFPREVVAAAAPLFQAD